MLGVCAAAFFAAACGAAAADTSINSGSTVSVSTLSSSDTPDFRGGTLQVDRSGSYANNFTLDVSSSSTATTTSTIDAHGNAGTFTGIFSDSTATSAALTITDSVGGGTVVFSGVNTYTNPTIVNSGATLSLTGTGSIASSGYLDVEGTFDISGTTNGAIVPVLEGAGTVNLGASNLTITAASTTFSGVIGGSGGITLTGGTLTLTGANTYTGVTTIEDATLQIGANSTTGSIAGNIASSGTVIFDRSDNITFEQAITGSGGVTQASAGTLTFDTAQAYTGVTTISTGTLALAGNGSIAASSVNAIGTFDISQTNAGASITSLQGSGTVQLGAQTLTLTSASGTFTGTITGSGGLTVDGGTEILLGTASYTGATIINGGTLELSQKAVASNITDNATLGFFSGGAIAVTGLVSGSGGISQLGTGVTTISTPQAYTGATLISNGTLALSGAGNIASSSGVTANATFDISATTGASITSLAGSGTVNLGAQTLTLTNASGSFGGGIIGTGGITVAGGTQTLTGSNAYTGVTTIAAGTLAISGAGVIAATSVVDNATLDLSGASVFGIGRTVSIASLSGTGQVVLGAQNLGVTNAASTFAGTISGTGGLTVSGGTETLTGSNSYSGVTTITAGTLALSGAGALTATSQIADNGTFDISAASGGTVSTGSLSGSGTIALGANSLNLTAATGDFSGVIAGTGGLVVSGGTQILSGTNTYGGGTTISSGGTLQLGDGQSAGTVVGNVLDNGTLAFDRAGVSTFSGTITGSGSVNQAGPGTTIFVTANSYSGGTTITEGVLQLGNGGTTGAITGAVNDNGTLAFDRSDAVTFGAVISGTGGINQIGPGTLTLTGVNSFTGVTSIASGSTLVLGGAGSIATSSVQDNGVLDVSAPGAVAQIQSLGGSGSVLLGGQGLQLSNAADSFSGAISGSGGLALGGGSETLSGVNSYTGVTQVNGGTLSVTGSIASSSATVVNSGGTLTGTGSVSALQVASGGTVSPGLGGSGTLSVNGAATFASGSNLLVNVSSASASKLAVSGSAALGGTLSVASTDGTLPLGQTLTLLTASGGVTGSFTLAPITGLGANYSSALSYDANDVYLKILLTKLSPQLPSGASVNQVNPIGGIDAAIARGDTLPQAFENLGNAASTVLASDASQLAGQPGADIARAGHTLFAPFMNTIFDHMADTGGARQVWVLGMAGSDAVAGNAALGSERLRSNVTGISAGGDVALSRRVTLGGAISVGSSNFRVAGGLGTGKNDAVQLAGYGNLQFTPHIYGSFAGILALDDIKTDRVLSVSGSDELAGKVKAFMAGGRYETGINLGWAAPYVALQDEFFDAPSYGETAAAGSATYALNYAAQTRNTADIEAGLRQSSTIRLGRYWSVKLTDRLGWMHDMPGASGVQAAFSALAGSNFTVYGARAGRDSGLLSLGAEAREAGGLSLNLHFESAIASNSQTYTGIAGAAYRW